MKKTTLSKDRVRAFFERRVGDRVAIDYFGNPDIDRRLKAHYGIKPDDAEALHRALGVDFVSIYPRYTGKRLHPEIPGINVDPVWGFRHRWIGHESGGYWDIADWPLRDARLEEVEAWPMPDPDDFDYAAVAKTCAQHGEYALYVGGGGTGDVINGTGRLRTMDQVLVDMMTDEPAGLALFDRWVGAHLGIVTRVLESAGGAIDFVWIGEDLGTQRGPMMSMDLFNKHIRPRLQLFIDLARRHGLPVMVHSCGSSSWAFDSFIDMGVTAIDTLQPEAKDMAPAYLKHRFGNRLALHGMISTAGVLAYGSVDQVITNVRQTLATMMPGGGYALSPTHMIQDNTPTENVVAMYEAGRRFGVYR